MKTGALLLVLVGSAIAAVTGAVAVPPKPKAPTAVAATPAAAPGILVYYFHATSRCGTCRTIEAYTHETVTSRFGPDLQARRLEWRAVNIEEAANRHFIRDYRLYPVWTPASAERPGRDPGPGKARRSGHAVHGGVCAVVATSGGEASSFFCRRARGPWIDSSSTSKTRVALGGIPRVPRRP